jgi:small subunit ribosomal protein S18
MAKREKRSAAGQKLVPSKSKVAQARAAFPGCPKGYEPRPAFIDYKDVATLKKCVSAQGKLFSRKRTGLSMPMHKALARAVKRARFLGLMPYVGD